MKKLILTSIFLFSFQFAFCQPTYGASSGAITYDQAEIKPEYLGGYNEFIKFFASNYNTPEVEGLSGIAIVTYIIEVNGRVTNIKVTKDLGSGIGEEAIRVLKMCPIWTPGELDGKRVRVKMELPITIKN